MHFPGDYNEEVYVFGVRGARRMDSDRVLTGNPFLFCLPHAIYYACGYFCNLNLRSVLLLSAIFGSEVFFQ